MAILRTKNEMKAKAEKKPEVAGGAVALKSNGGSRLSSRSSGLLRPRITEKSGDISQKLNGYTFEIAPKTSKKEVAKEIKNLYKVAPVKINIINLPRKKMFLRGKKGFKGGVKKAIVYLKKDDKIEFI